LPSHREKALYHLTIRKRMSLGDAEFFYCGARASASGACWCEVEVWCCGSQGESESHVRKLKLAGAMRRGWCGSRGGCESHVRKQWLAGAMRRGCAAHYSAVRLHLDSATLHLDGGAIALYKKRESHICKQAYMCDSLFLCTAIRLIPCIP
jgi:hypothetical protein